MPKVTLSASVCIVFIFIFLTLQTFISAKIIENEWIILGRSRRSFSAQKGERKHPSGNLLATSFSKGRAPIFGTENATVAIAQVGGTATLPCVVRKFSNGVVSWIRKEEPPVLLTVGSSTYSASDRFLVAHVRHLQNWGLVIKHVRNSDAGLYECQISTHPPTSIFVTLKVTEATADILGSPDLHLRVGSLLRLICTLKDSTEIPSHVFWYHEDRMINFDEGVQVLTSKSSSILIFKDTVQRHSGNYTCSPSNAIPASINVHLLNATEEENPAAMLHASGSSLDLCIFLVLLVPMVLIVEMIR